MRWILQKTLATGRHMEFNFGTFQVKEMKGKRIALNGGVTIPKRKSLVFKQSPAIKRLLNE